MISLRRNKSSKNVYIDEQYLNDYLDERHARKETSSSIGIKVIKTLFSPLSPLIIMIVSFLLNTITMNATSDQPFLIKNCIENREIIYFSILCWFIITIIVAIVEGKFSELEMDLTREKRKVSELEFALKNSSAVIRDNLSTFFMGADKIILEKLIKQEVRNNIFLDSAQIYTYSSFRSSHNIEIKCNFVVGYASERFEINSILQSYYCLNVEQFKKFKDIMTKYRNLSTKKDEPEYLRILIDIIEIAQQLITRIKIDYSKDIFNQESVNDEMSVLLNTIINDFGNFTEKDLQNYVKRDPLLTQDTMLIKLKKILRNAENESKNKKTSFDSMKKDNDKRTGLLGAILSEDIYTFQNIQSNNPQKSGRMYACYSFLFRNKQYVALYAVNKDYKNDVEYLKTEIKRLQTQFSKNLESYL